MNPYYSIAMCFDDQSCMYGGAGGIARIYYGEDPEWEETGSSCVDSQSNCAQIIEQLTCGGVAANGTPISEFCMASCGMCCEDDIGNCNQLIAQMTCDGDISTMNPSLEVGTLVSSMCQASCGMCGVEIAEETTEEPCVDNP